MSERRNSVRQRAFLKGVVWFNNRTASIDCTIRDVSETGARLVMASDISVPNNVEVDIPSKDQRCHATVRWRNGNEIGVSFDRGGSRPGAAAGVPGGDVETRLAYLEAEVEKLRRSLGRIRTDMLKAGDRDLISE